MNQTNQEVLRALRLTGRVLWQAVKFTAGALLLTAQLLAVLVGLIFAESSRAQKEARRDLLR